MHILPHRILSSFQWIQKVSVLNNFCIAPPQIHLVSWAFVIFFPILVRVKEGKLTMGLFFHIFKTQDNPNYTNDSGFLSLSQYIRYFETYFDSVKNFKDHFYLIIHLNEKAYAKICNLEHGSPLVCTHVFSEYWTQSHYLIGWDHMLTRRDTCVKRSYTWRTSWWSSVKI